MREDVAHDARAGAASAPRAGASSMAPGGLVIRLPGAGRHLGHAAEQALRRAGAQQDRAVGAHGHEGRAAAQWPLRLLLLLAGSVSCSARRRAPGRAPSRGRGRRPGRFGVQIVAPRSIIACAKSPGRSRRHQRPASARISGLASGSGVLDREEPRHHPLDIAVDRRRRPVEGDRRDRRRRVGADAGQAPASSASRVGKAPADAARRRPWRRHGGCGRASNSRARPRPACTSSSGAAASASTVGQARRGSASK